MSIRRIYRQSCPLLLESDILSLSPYLNLKDGCLADELLGLRHKLHGPAPAILAHLVPGATYRQLIVFATEVGLAENDLRDLLGFLNTIGGLKRQRRDKCYVGLGLSLRQIFLGIGVASITHRETITFQNVVIAALRATTPVFLATGVVAALMWGARLGSASTIIVYCSVWLLLFTISLLVHEYSHIYALKMRKVPVHIFQRGLMLGIVHRQPSPILEICSSLSGPIIGALAALLIGFGLQYTALDSLAGAISYFGASLHLVSLLPWYGDGASFLKALRRLLSHETNRSYRSHSS